jgi:hypothetical protein
MNDIVKRSLGSTALSNDLADRLLAGIEESQSTTLVAGGGKDLIKLSKNDGTWNIGQADEPMQVGSRWLINILSICHGFICWSNYPGSRKNERLGEVMVPMSEPKPSKPGPIEGFPFQEQRSFEAICLNGEDAGAEVMFKNGSVGTMKGFKKLEDAVKSQLRTDRAFPCPVIMFKSEKYKHSDYGWIHNPIFEVVDWSDLQGNLKSNGPVPALPKDMGSTPAATTARPRKPALVEEAPVQEPADDKLEPVNSPPPRAQRRRPAVA